MTTITYNDYVICKECGGDGCWRNGHNGDEESCSRCEGTGSVSVALCEWETQREKALDHADEIGNRYMKQWYAKHPRPKRKT